MIQLDVDIVAVRRKPEIEMLEEPKRKQEGRKMEIKTGNWNTGDCGCCPSCCMPVPVSEGKDRTPPVISFGDSTAVYEDGMDESLCCRRLRSDG